MIRWAGLLGLFGVALAASVAPGAGQQPVTIGPLEGPTQGDEGDALAFSVFVHGSETPASFTWDFGDGSEPLTGAGLSGVSHEYLEGDSTYTLTVDIQAAGASRRHSMDVQIRNAAPSIELLEVQPGLRFDQPIEFVAQATDPGDDPLTYRWDFGDGSDPVEGTDLRRIRHQFPAEDAYTVTLTVTDEEPLSDQASVTLPKPGFRGRVAGALSMNLDADPGSVDWPGAMTSVLRGGPTTVDACTYSAEFVDDDERVTMALIWVSAGDRGLVPGSYSVTSPRRQGAPGPGTAVVNLAHAVDGQMWERVRDRGGAPPGDDEAASAGLGGLVGRLRDRITGGGGAPIPSPYGGGAPYIAGGETAVFMGASGTLQIDRVDGQWVHGSVRLGLEGHHMRPEGFEPFEEEVEIEGSFVWALDETSQSAAARCGRPPFNVERHRPEPNERLVRFIDPDIEIVFTQRFREETVTDETVQFGFLNARREFERVEGELVVDAQSRSVRFVPAEPLRTMIFYRVRVIGGEGGVLGEDGDRLPDDIYEWRFGTAPRPVPGARGSR